MPPDPDPRLRALAEVVVRVGVNLQPGQPLLITDPYELQGIHPEAAALADAVCAVARESGNPEPLVLTAEPGRLRALAADGDRRAYAALLTAQARQLERHLARGGAFLFLTGSDPGLWESLSPEVTADFERRKWESFGPVIRRLVRGETQWTLLPAPATAWADRVFPELPADARLAALWEVVFSACRAGPAFPGFWPEHLAELSRRRDRLNAACHRTMIYRGPGTELRVTLPRSHVWCTAQLATPRGVPFVVNLPTDEVFTAPDAGSATGRLRVARPVAHAGVVLQDIELEFARGRVVAATARTGGDVLQQLLAADGGAARLGEVAIVPALLSGPPRAWQGARPVFHHAILDENAAHHVALGNAYRFCSRAWWPLAINSSQVHVDLPIAGTVTLE